MSRTQSTSERSVGALEALERFEAGFVALDVEQRYSYVNRSASALLGQPAEVLVGRHVWEVFPHGVGTPVHRAMERAVRTGTTTTVEDYWESWDRWYENRIHPHADGLHIYFTDITHRIELERALREHAVLAERSGFGIAVLRSEEVGGALRIESANRALGTVLGVAEAGLIGEELGPEHVLALGMRLDVVCAEARRTGSTVDLGHRTWEGPAGPRDLRVRAVPMHGRAVGILIEDVTAERRAADERLQLAASLLRTAEDDRHALGRALRGGPLETLVATALRAGSAAATTSDPGASAELEAIEAEMRSAVLELLAVLADRYPPQLADLGLGAAVAALAQAHGIPITLTGDAGGACDVVRDVAYRVVRDVAGAAMAARRPGDSGGALEVHLEGADDGGLSLTFSALRVAPALGAETSAWVQLLGGGVGTRAASSDPEGGQVLEVRLAGAP